MADETTPAPVETPPEQPPAESGAGARRKVGLAAVAIMLIHFVARLGGYIQKKVLAHFFGTSMAADSATFMQRIFELVYYIPEELLTHSLLPVFSKARDQDGEAAAWRMASLAGTIQAMLLVLVTLFAWLWGDLLCAAVIGWPDPTDLDYATQQARFELTVRLVRVAMLGLFCTSLGSLTYVLLNAYKRFVTPALGDVAQKAGIVIGTVAVCVQFGDALGPMGYAIGFILGGLFKITVHLVSLGGKLKLVRPGFDFRNPHLRELGLLMLPLIGGTLFSKLRGGVETNIIARIPAVGAAASLDYAQKLVWMPVLVIPYALGIALFPFLADWAQQKDRARVTEAFLGASRLMLFVFIPMAAMFCLLDHSIVTLLYKSGKFTEASVELVAAPFFIYSLGLPFYGLEIIALQVFYSHRDTTRPFVLGVISSTLQIAVAWLFALKLGLGASGVALGLVAGRLTKVVLSWWQLRPRLEGYDWPGLASLLSKTALATLAMSAGLVGVRLAAPRVLDLDRPMHAALMIVVAGLVGLVVFACVAAALRVPELDTVRRQVLRKLRRKG